MNPAMILMDYRPVLLLADAGLSLTVLVYPFTLVLLIPIIIIEAAVIQRRLQYDEFWPVLRASAAANVVSTILGIPLTWVLYLLPFGFNVQNRVADAVLDTVIWPWAAPSALTRAWAVPLADVVFLVLLVPYYFVSVWSESKVMERMLPLGAETTDGQMLPIALPQNKCAIEQSTLRRAVWVANLLSYALMFSVFCLSAFSFR
ncbi:MAG TPA: hypothetical protein VMU24_08475 [Candidatus Acidoferrales bacterium]|nr:hypothetical protein [Candidatus Acidoferrales bacterium]